MLDPDEDKIAVPSHKKSPPFMSALIPQTEQTPSQPRPRRLPRVRPVEAEHGMQSETD